MKIYYLCLILALYLSAPAFCGEIHDAAGIGDVQRVAALLKKDPGLILSKNEIGFTPLHVAAETGQMRVAKLLMANKADVNARSNSGYTPLHRAALKGRKNIVELLLASNADVDARMDFGSTPLHLAALEGEKGIAKLLLHNKADVNARANNGYTPLHAAAQGRLEMVELLLANKADANARNNADQTPLDIAMQLKKMDIVKALRRLGGHGTADLHSYRQPAGKGSALVFSTYFGGGKKNWREQTHGAGIAVDKQGNVYVTGRTQARDFPLLNPAQKEHGGGKNDAFLAKFSPDGQRLVYSTVFGGRDVDFAERVAVDSEGNAYIAGTTYSRNFPTTPQAAQQRFGGGDRDGFVAKLSADGKLIYSTLLGGNQTDRCTAIDVDAAGNAYITGSTNSTNFALPGDFAAKV
jgi:hypothetical protein